MWLTQQLIHDGGSRVTTGQVTGGGTNTVFGENAFQELEKVSPYGITSIPVHGDTALLVEGYCVGVAEHPASSLQEGEVRLYSAGGAEILLKQNGSVVINGQVFSRP